MFFYSFLIIKPSQEWGRTWYSPLQSKIEAKLHEESKFRRASKPLSNQSSMQGRESEKESNIHEFRNPLRIAQEGISQVLRIWGSILQPLAKFSQAKKEFRKRCETDEFRNPLRNFHNPLRNFRKPKGILQALRNWWILQPLAKFSQPCKIFLIILDIFAQTPLDFYLMIFCVIIYSFLVIS